MTVREILFKAKRTDNGEWVEGDLIQAQDKKYIAFGWSIDNEGEQYYNFDCALVYEVEPETVCQYTGLTDKNGVKIWEGDILELKRKDIFAGGAYTLTTKYRYGDRLVVRCLPAGFMLCQLEDSFPDSPSSNGKIDNYSFWNCQGFWEVIGNIHDIT